MSRARPAPPSPAPADPQAVAALLRGLAERVEADAAFGAQVAAALRASGLLAAGGSAASKAGAEDERRSVRPDGAPAGATAFVLPDPFALLRTGEEEALRRALEALALADLRRIVRAHRLDPARISARWTARERVVQLIVSQVRARLDHGKAFSHV